MNTTKSSFSPRLNELNVFNSKHSYQIRFNMDGLEDLDYILYLDGENESEALTKLELIFPERKRNVLSIHMC